MGTIADKLNHLINTKEGIRQEINRAYNAEEISTSDTFNSYIQKLEEHPFYIMRYIERSIESIKLSSVTSIGQSAFSSCSNLTEASFPKATSIGGSAFNGCSSLTTIYVGTNTSTVCTLSNTNAFNNCTNLTNIYVPASLVDSYKSATNWSNYASKIKAVPQGGGGGVTNKSISVTTSGISDYGWITADSQYNVDGYDVYMSENSGVETNAVMKLECVGYTELTIYIRANTNDHYEAYAITSIANASSYPTSYDDSNAKASTRGIVSSGNDISSYTAVNYTGLSGNDTVYIVFRKNFYPAIEPENDRGFVLIPKQ